jgi:capsular exopolysaccharide synthesis family protein
MGRTHEALKRAEREKSKATAKENGKATGGENGFQANGHNVSSNGHNAPKVYLRDPQESVLEYEKIGAWLTNPVTAGKRLQVVMVVAPHSGTGNTTTAALLAETLANVKKRRVLIIDSNFRTPGLNMVFQVKNDGGFIEAASDGVPFETHIQPTNRPNLFVLTCGQISLSPAEVFEGDAIDQLIGKLRENFDFILFDAAPVIDFPDSLALASKVDSIILVVQSEKTTIESAQMAKMNLERVGGQILGVVLNHQKEYTPSFLKRFL